MFVFDSKWYNFAVAVAKENLPITRVVESVCRQSCGSFSLNRFREHVAPLEIQAKGDVLIIGAGELMEEVAIIEPEIAAGSVKSVTLIGSRPVLANRAIEAARDYDANLAIEPISYGMYFNDDNSPTFDTMIFVGTVSSHLPEKLEYLSAPLRPAGRLYLTVNGRSPLSLDELPGCRARVINNIPSNPNYDIIPDYFGVVVEKE